MKGSWFGAGLLVLVLLIGSTSGLFAQRTVDVPAGFGTLQAILSADSANRVANPSTVYLVHRGTADSVYIMTSTLTGWGSMPLNIRSVGSGMLPEFKWVAKGDGSSYSPLISAKADLSLKGVYLNGVNVLGVTVDRMVRIQANGVTVKFDSVYANRSTQSFIRVDNTNARIFLTGCRVSNVFSDWANARGVDNRGITIDTLSMTNCSFFRIGQRIYRDGGGILTYGNFNHNTFTETGVAILSLGSAEKIVFKNNLAVNCGILGDTLNSTARLIGLTPLPSGQSVYAGYNVFWVDSAAFRAAYPDTIGVIGWFADTINTFISAAGLTETNISSPVTFTRAPNSVPGAVTTDSIARWYWLNLPGSSTDASRLGIDSVHLVNLAYNTNAPAYTWGLDGKPAGATDWFGIVVGVAGEAGAALPEGYALLQNYPNPFNPSTSITYSIPVAAQVYLEIFNLLGQSVRVVADAREEAGVHTVQWDGRDSAGRILPSGIYLYRLNTGAVTLSQKMILMK